MSDSKKAVSDLISGESPVRWLFCGDSITHGACHTWGHRDYTQHFAERVRFEMRRGRDIVINSAVGGETSRDLLADFDWRVTQFRPDAVFLMMGMNDCEQTRTMKVEEFRANLEEFCRRVREVVGSLVVLQTSPPIIKGMGPNREGSFPAFMDAIRSVAHSRALPLVDHQAFWQQNANKHTFWMSDAIHPGSYGHLALATCLFEALGIFDASSNTCRLFVP
jgi:lysophospholipase L1-like esterase